MMGWAHIYGCGIATFELRDLDFVKMMVCSQVVSVCAFLVYKHI